MILYLELAIAWGSMGGIGAIACGRWAVHCQCMVGVALGESHALSDGLGI